MEIGEVLTEKPSNRTTYRRYESGIHEIVFHEPTRVAADEFIVHLDAIFAEHTQSNEPYFLLVDAGPHIQIPLRYVFQRGRDLNQKKYPTVPQGGRSVYVFAKTFLVTVLDAFLRIARPQVARRYLEPQQREEAIEWLLDGIEAHRQLQKEESSLTSTLNPDDAAAD